MKKIFSFKLALKLKNMGNELLYTEENTNNKKFKVFVFENTRKLQDDLTEIMNNK